ncbi:rust resistance kinase Lr10-like isoform X2 [Nymphaea colorata]|uniref:rust resistance kinase Lr10-like isoform X2 n=1 Tax=Nymphaea colorata TaxID=210225 RepID=UPI00214E9248|nr:rust resistance kinase Lr10-like isoform X2 [Nymphaea colorata]
MKAFFFCSFLLFCFNPSFTAAEIPEYRDCAPASCNGIAVHYPFSLSAYTPGTSCSVPGLKLTCQGDKADALLSLITPTGLKLIVKSINYTTQTIKLAIDRSLPVVNNQCPLPSRNITFSHITNSDGESILSFATNYTMGIFFFGCSTKPNFTGVPDFSGGDSSSYNFTSNLVSACSDPGATSYSYAFSDDSFTLASWTSCRTTLGFPVLISSSSRDARTMWTSLTEGFDVVWTVNSMGDCLGCTASGGRCGYNTTGDHFLCFCRQDAHSVNCNQPDAPSPSSSRGTSKWKTIIGLGAAAFGSIFLLVCLLYCFTRSGSLFQPHPPVKVEKFLLDYATLTATRYTYNDIIKMTKKFKHKVGQGGYGSVFQGWLPNGTVVAVKLIEKSHKDGEEFCNEVATIGRIHHVNVVRLFGFCVEGSRRALVYEFMTNGSLEKFTNTTDVGHCVLRERLYDIALGIARGIEYLHQGCDQRIIHFDIKPHNILLDHNFTPKISDFGLAKSYCKDRSSVTITEGKGTIGYIAPELFYGNSRHVSHKSDVYSFGMLLIAMVGLKEKIGPADGSSSEAYFPQWIHDTISNDQKFEGIGEDEDEMVRKVATIGLWCIQWSPIDRPCMKEVIRMFESSTSNLTMPPKHFCPAIQPDYMIEALDSSSTYSGY